MTGTAVMVVMTVVAMVITPRFAVVVPGIAISVDHYSVIPVCSVTRRCLPGEGRRQHRRQHDGNQETSNGSQGAAHRRIVPK